MVQPMPVRAKFYKVGSLQYISHLDLVRTMTRNLVRSGIPAWYSQGFNPRLKLTFSLPLSIGTQSECEFFDIRLTEEMSLEEVKARINDTLTCEMKITEVYQSDRKFTDIAWALYDISMTSNDITDSTAEKLTALYTNPLVVTKRSKSGDKEVDISPYIDLRGVSQNENTVSMQVLLSADSAGYLNPEYLVKAAQMNLGVTFEDPFSEYYTIMRKEVYLADKVTAFR